MGKENKLARFSINVNDKENTKNLILNILQFAGKDVSKYAAQ
jgi:hypothetical protein